MAKRTPHRHHPFDDFPTTMRFAFLIYGERKSFFSREIFLSYAGLKIVRHSKKDGNTFAYAQKSFLP